MLNTEYKDSLSQRSPTVFSLSKYRVNCFAKVTQYMSIIWKHVKRDCGLMTNGVYK